MERRASSRVSEAQWGILLEFLRSHPNLARTRGYNNSAQGRAESLRLWQDVANKLNSEGSGTTKSPKEWSIYVSNYKSKLKKIVADINADSTATGGGPPRSSRLSDWDNQFLALLGPGFGQTAPQVRVLPFPDEQPYNSDYLPETPVVIEVIEDADIAQSQEEAIEPVEQPEQELPVAPELEERLFPVRTRQRRYRTRPLAPLDEARRILSQVETQRAASDAANAQANQMIAGNIGRVADSLERLANVAEQYLAFHIQQ